ncbi:MAG: hypothetical protein L0H64_23515 [Pseudonocardia sp.]|nr:hypothetical protein [Pseudonocardia sp.]
MFRAPPPERHRRRDLLATAVLVLSLAGAAVAVGWSSDIAGTTSRPADTAITAPPPATGIPARFALAWSAPSEHSPVPVVAGPAVVTASGSTVVGRDARTGEERWSYSRDLPLCAVGAAFPAATQGRVIALYANDAEPTGDDSDAGLYCSELTMLHAATGERAGARNPDARPGVRLIADDTYLLLLGDDHLEVLRSDLVRTLEYGAVPAQEQVGRQPRPECRYGSAVLGGGLVGVIERCPGEAGDRLTVLAADGDDGAEEPEEKYSVVLPGTGAEIVALTAERAAVTLDGRLRVFDATGTEVARDDVTRPDLDVPPCPEETARFVRAGSSVLALDPCSLAPRWTVPDTLGAPVRYGVDLLVPVPGGLQVVDIEDGTPGRVLPVDRPDPDAPVALAVQGEVLLEQRGAEVFALTPMS